MDGNDANERASKTGISSEMKGMPTSFLYAPSGKLVGHHDGPLTQTDIEQAMAQKPASAALFAH